MNFPLSTFSPYKYYQEEPKDNPKQKAQQHLQQVQVWFLLLAFTNTTLFHKTVTTLSVRKQISTPTTTSPQHLKSVLTHQN